MMGESVRINMEEFMGHIVLDQKRVWDDDGCTTYGRARHSGRHILD